MFDRYKLNKYDIDCINMYYNAMFNGKGLVFQPEYCILCKSFGPNCPLSHDPDKMFSKCDKFELYKDPANNT